MSDNDISKVHIIFQIPAEAVCDIGRFNNMLGDAAVRGAELKLDELRQVAKRTLQTSRDTDSSVVSKIARGKNLPDGLTRFGDLCIHEFVRSYQNPTHRLRCVRALVCAPTTRAFMTLQQVSEAYELVSYRSRVDGQSHKRVVHCHPGLLEPFRGPEDLPAMVVQNHVSYIQPRGGILPNSGEIVGERRIDMTWMKWEAEQDNQFRTVEARHRAVTSAPDPDGTLQRAKKFRHWLRNLAKEVLAEHRDLLRPGTLATGRPKIVVCLDSAMLSFVTKHWYPKWTMGDEIDTHRRMHSNNILNPLDTVVYRFSSDTDPDANLEEVARDETYQLAFGNHYHYIGHDVNDISQREGTSQQRLYWAVIERCRSDTRATAEESPELLEELLCWRGAAALAQK
ncbi:Fc.00g080100.m01.CDS01 [Cosmosporella sp. VM-42]